MRALILLPALSLLGTAANAEFHIVVRTTDAVENRIYRDCGERGRELQEPVDVFIDRKPGSASWHPVGGVAPYRVVRERSEANGYVCFTVVDAEGNQAEGCGMIGTRKVESTIPCNDKWPGPMPLKQDSIAPDKNAEEEIRTPPVPPTTKPYVPMDSRPTTTTVRPQTREREVGGGTSNPGTRTATPREGPSRTTHSNSGGTVKPSPAPVQKY